MLTSINGHLKGYFYDPDCLSRDGGGYIRTSSKEYNLAPGKINNRLIHLTNDAIQKKAEDYGKHETGNKITFKEYQQYLNETQSFSRLGDKSSVIDFQKEIFSSRIKQIVTETFLATHKIIDPNKR